MMKYCPHVELLYQLDKTIADGAVDSSKVNNNDAANSKCTDRLDTLYKCIIDLNILGKSSSLDGVSPIDDEQVKNVNRFNSKQLKCESCSLKPAAASSILPLFSSRLHLCASCMYLGCFNLSCPSSHIEQHAKTHDHYLSVDVTYGSVYCYLCKDFQYDQFIEDFARQLFLKEGYFPFGRFTEWEPSQSNLTILRKTYGHNFIKSFKLKSSSIIGLRGLINLGNTCFMNCILQTLTHIPSLRDYFLGDQHFCNKKNSNHYDQHNNSSNKNSSSGNYFSGGLNSSANKNLCLVCELVILFQEFYSGKRSPYIPFNLLHQVWTQVKHLAGYEQQDAHEFFIAALNAIHKNCIENDEICINLNKNKKKFINYNNCNCIIDKIFTGGLQSDVICSNCNHVSTTVDPFWDISLDLYKNSSKPIKSIKNDNSEKLKLEDCLFKFTLPEILTSFNCSNCKSSREARKQFTMKKLPIVCCFHLKRFEQSNRIHKKIFDHILFPEILDMSPFMSTINKNSANNENNSSSSPGSANGQCQKSMGKFYSNRYFLFAVVNHHGTLESGHYTSFIRLKNEQWFKCDDHIISKATINDVMNSEGYLLFYHRMWHEYD